MRRHAWSLLFALFVAAPAGCNRAGDQATLPPQPIRDEQEPGETTDYYSAVPEASGSSSGVSTSSSSEAEVDDDGTTAETETKTEDKADEEEPSDDGTEVEIEIEP